ncbi:hypothetical protein ACI0FM_08565 [Paenochrobactrum sp. BZR 588]|uniref:hypothetical protein n=1 Tax=unclassified Paenochrobactrum TaxID=2639760 RepID=UPI00385553A0
MKEEATIRRGVRNARYAAIPNHVFEDVRLSMEARWLLGYLLSKPDNWTVVLRDIMNKGSCGRDKARRIVAELVETGYAEKEQAREGGRFSALSLVIYDEPIRSAVVEPQTDCAVMDESVAFLPQTEKPSTVNPSTEKPAPVNPPLVITDNLENTDHKKEKKARESESSKKSLEQDSVSAEDDPKTAAFEKRVIRFLNGVGYDAGIWPKWDHQTTLAWIKGHFAGLIPAERKEAERWRDAYLLNAAERKVKPQGAGIFFRDRLWNALDPAILDRLEDAKAADASKTNKPDGWAACFGPVGMARLFAHFYEGAADEALASKTFLPNALFAKAWPKVMQFRMVQQQKGGAVFGQLWQELAHLFEPVPQGTEGLDAWKREFKRRNWPWLSEFDRLPVVYCPKGGVAGLAAFEAKLAEVKQDAAQ